MQIQAALNDYLKSIKHLRPLTREGYRQRIETFADWCEAQDPPVALEHVKATIVYEFVEHLRATRHSHKTEVDQLSTYTVAGYVRVIKTFLCWCMEEEGYEQYVKASVVKKIRKPKIDKCLIETFTKEQLQALFKACGQQNGRNINIDHLRLRDRAIISLLVDTGIRANELCTLTLANVKLDPDDAYIKVFGKGQKWREVGLGEQSHKALTQYLGQYRQGAKPSETVFVGRYREALTVSGLVQLIERLGQLAGIEGVRCSPHTFRHTYAVNYLLTGGDIFKLSILMGHSDIETTQVYLRTVHSRQVRRGKSVLDTLAIV